MNELQEHVRVRAPDQARERERERGRRKEGASNRRQSAACKVANHGAREGELVTEPVKGDSRAAAIQSDPQSPELGTRTRRTDADRLSSNAQYKGSATEIRHSL